MSNKNPIEKTKYIKSEFLDYLRSLFDIKDNGGPYSTQFEEQISSFNLVKGPYLTVTAPFECGSSIRELVKQGKMHPSFAGLGNVSKVLDLPLYRHQLQAIEKVESGRNVVVTTGTGSGKTECFLYPILDSIIKDIEAGEDSGGIRAIFLYPMNALINDQARRIREDLSCYPSIRFGFYTGGTPEDEKDKSEDRQLIKDQDDVGNEIDFPPNEVLYRRDIRANPPHILFTNYSMLEYMLLRPSDSAFLNPQGMRNWRFMVLDEAHTYRGAQAIEIAMLIRRLRGWAERDPQFILTSATLGKGESDINEIVQFASRLTSSRFEPDDIIFSKRVPILEKSFDLKVSESDYREMVGRMETGQSILPLVQKYIPSVDKTFATNILLSLLLKRDINAYRLFAATKGRERPFHEIQAELEAEYGLGKQGLIDLVELIAKASDEFDHPVFSVKYHTFMRAPEGAFITLKPSPALQLRKCKEIDGLHAFAMAICSNCGTPYVFGKRVNGVLEIGGDIEETEETTDKQDYFEYYALADYLDDEDVDALLAAAEARATKTPGKTLDDIPHECFICSKCGHVHDPSDLASGKCGCGDQYLNRVIKVPSKTKPDYCAVCNQGGNKVVDLHVGKDRAASILSQIILRSMGEETSKQNQPVSIDPFAIQQKESPKSEGKQLILFSDSRQNAAYFAPLFNNIEGHFEKKAMLLRLLQEESDRTGSPRPIAMEELQNRLCLKYQQFFHMSEITPKDEAWIAILYELLRTEGNNSADNLGMYAFVIDYDTINKNKGPAHYDDPNLSVILAGKGFAGITNQQFMDLTSEIVDRFRIAPAINYPLFSEKVKLRDYINYRSNDCSIKLQGNSDDGDYVFSLLPKKPRKSSKVPKENSLLNYAMRAFSLSRTKAEELIGLAFNFAINAGLIVDKVPSGDRKTDFANTYAVNADSFILAPKESLHFYRCPKCHRVSIRNINDVCRSPDCDGHLEEVTDVDSLYRKSYYRRVYMQKPIEEIVAEEHTAQIDKRRAHNIQIDFKQKRINVLSCSTTFEMGIDIGSLDTVMMKNVPPSPSNYAQRAGRAGRRSGKPAFVFTFCNVNSHDSTFFDNPCPMIRGVIDAPTFKINNEKIILRHIMAAVLGRYFKDHPDDFSSVEAFLDDHSADAIEGLLTKDSPARSDLSAFIEKNLLLEDELKDKYGHYQWVDLLMNSQSGGPGTGLLLAIQDIERSIQNFEDHIATLPSGNSERRYYDEQIGKIKGTSMVEALSQYNIIPNYGFPYDTVKLTVFDEKTGLPRTDLQLTRPLSVAISEYAPDSEVIAAKKKFTSRYIALPKTHDANSTLTTMFYYSCPNPQCGKVFLKDTVPSFPCTCPSCGEQIEAPKVRSFLIPSLGFIADRREKRSATIAPKRSYASDVYHIGGGKVFGSKVILGQALTAETSENDILLRVNSNPFFFCESCGYAHIDKHAVLDSKNSGGHHRSDGTPCNHSLKRIGIGYYYRTDVITVRLNLPMTESRALSFLHAFLGGVSAAFHLERRDIGGVLEHYGKQGLWQVVVYDAVAGGAGFVKLLASKDGMLKALDHALSIVSKNCCSDDTSCYQCLRNYENRKIHDKLVVGEAREAIKELLRLSLLPPDDGQTTTPIIPPKVIMVKRQMSTVIDVSNAVAVSSYQEIIDDYYALEIMEPFINASIPLPEYLEAPLDSVRTSMDIAAGIEIPNAMLCWPSRNLAIFHDAISEQSLKYMKALGWKVYRIGEIDLSTLKEAFL